MFIEKWKHTLEIYQNSFYKIIFVIFLGFIFSCKTPIYKRPYCLEFKNFKEILQSINIAPNKWILISFDVSNRDYKNEIINDVKLFYVELKGDELLYKDIKIVGRDDYPLKPISLAYDEFTKTLYMLNVAFNLQRSIEIYTLKDETLIFKNRYRSKNFQKIISITFWKDKLIALNHLDTLITIDPITFFEFKNGQFESIKTKITYATRIKTINDKFYVFVPKNKQILQLDSHYNIIKTLQFDLIPYDMTFYYNKFIIILNKKYINLYNNQSNFINNESFVYYIPEVFINQNRKFKLTDTDFEKYFVNNNAYFDIFYFTIPKKDSLEIILNQYTIYSNRCSIISDFDK